MSIPGPRDPQSLPHRQQLQRAVERLQAELATTPTMDTGSRKLLRGALIDIERALAAETAPSHPGGAHASRLEAMAVEFDAQHPGIAGSLRQLIDLLGRAGI